MAKKARRAARGPHGPRASGAPDRSGGGRSADATAWRSAIETHLREHPSRPLKARALARALDVSDDDYPEFKALLRSMLDTGAVQLGRGRALKPAGDAAAALPTGRYRAHRDGFGFVELAGQQDVYVPRGQAGDALDGDTVQIRVHRRAGDTRGEVVRVVQRAPIVWVGRLLRDAANWIVEPQGRAAAPVVRIDDPTAKGARPGDLVVVEPIGSRLHGSVVRGVIVERLGAPDASMTHVLGVVRRYQLAEQFPPDVRAAAQQAAAGFDPDRLDGRQDLRDLLTITIDPADARDFDDAISVEPLRGGRTRLGVHIADVSHFVTPGGVLDGEAAQRGNSVYFPGYVVPMLPEVLSNGVCSLQPHQPRFAKSVFVTYDQQANPVEAQVASSVICSSARLTCEQASAALAGDEQAAPPQILRLLKLAESLAKLIQKRRRAAGMIALQMSEPHVEIAPSGEVSNAYAADTSFSHTLIEMFMVEANESVSRLLHERGVPHLCRVHPPPDPDSLRYLSRQLAAIGHPLGGLERRHLQKLLDSVKDAPEEAAVSYLVLRSMAPASYGVSTLGHYALASAHYCHFTSPIRRYPDLTVHRLVDVLSRDPDAAEETPSADALAALGEHLSQTERHAQDAERESRAILLLELMQRKVGQSFSGVVTGVTSFGVFVQTQPHLAEGMIPVRNLPRGPWRFDRRVGVLTGASGEVLRIGLPVRVRVVAVDLVRIMMTLSLQWLEDRPIASRPRASKRTRRG